jgi:hypothetical protein
MMAVTLATPAKPKLPNRWTAWLIWRQQRGAFAGFTLLASALSGLLILAALKVQHADALGLRTCLASGIGDDCTAASSLLAQAQEQLRDLKVALLVVPAVIGAFGGAPLVAREHETGITRYTWTQGLRPEHWLAGTLLLGSLVVVTFMSIAGILFNWATGLAGLGSGFTVSPTTFDAQFPALPAWSLFAYLLGISCGMAIRRTVPAMGATLVAYEVIVHLAIDYLRPHYAAVVFWEQVSGDVNPFWQYQIIQVVWLILVAIITAALLVICPKLYRANAWKRAGRHMK